MNPPQTGKAMPRLDSEIVIQQAAILAAVETGLGSVLHGLSIPFCGHILSLNQGFLLSRGILLSGGYLLPISVSNIGAVMKSLSPVGKRLTPMLAISAQGFCFAIGPAFLGTGFAGLSLGMILLSLWGFLQPLLIMYLLFGSPLVEALTSLLPGNTPWILVAIVILAKALLGIAVAALALWLPESAVLRYQRRLLKFGASRRKGEMGRLKNQVSLGQHAWSAAREMAHPLFLLSLGLTVTFFVWVDSPISTILWGLLRPIAGGFLIFFLVRLIPWKRIKFGATVERAASVLRDL